MSIFNRRNALLGWGAWKIGKRIGKRKIRKAAPAKMAIVGSVLAGGFVAARRLA
jgi:hypothetical protein